MPRLSLAITASQRAVAVAVMACVWLPGGAIAVDNKQAAPETSVATPAPGDDRKRQTEQELETIARDIKLGEERQAEIAREIGALDKDRTRVNEQLVATTARTRALENQVGATETRIQGIEAEADTLRKSLSQRRAVLADVLAALQRIGRKPPPAVVVRPEDALASVRSAILIGAVLPELRGEAEHLANDLGRLVALRDRSSTERDQFRQDVAALKDETARLEQLMEERRRSKGDQQKRLDEERRHAQDLADKAVSLKDLITRLEADIDSTRRAADAARKSDELEARRKADLEKQASLDPRPDQKSVTPSNLDAGRLQPAIPFAETKGKLPMPVSGQILKNFGDDDGTGSTLKGIRVATRPEARVASPCDGWVVYAGVFRSYGKVLIIYGGGGYHVLLAGMDRIDVEHGQFVLAGEPVGVMGSRRVASATTDLNSAGSSLYVEFRKDNASIDPTPWWVQARDEKVRG